ncbi:carboxypeptidase regulatory-like domain-containing protein [Nocardioides sp. IC4_145]|uniref:carboxypeptidase regulatory-like domain-containing protein n=1 Tax=Nocardioides sp. IC4_145 TaxID=2714037 RepID=UPI00140E9250|nr:carboxypeptidase regulatory-like domain-containing protein [Nocardioides sp. IC4_145]NHC23034.1 carboxypeptidase regulatory-like domain-containing protein [Nocardioides sp. IC4_145]
MPSSPSTRLRSGPLAVLLTALALVLGALSAAPASAADPAAAGTISGLVTTDGGVPVRGVTITVERRSTDASGAVVWTEAQTTRATTAADGTYTATVPSGTYKVGFVASGFVAEWYDGRSTRELADDVVVDAGGSERLDPATLVARTAGATVSGTVRTVAGRPFPDAEVTPYRFVIEQDGSQTWAPVPGTTAETAADGTYSLTLAPGTYRIGFSHPGYGETFVGGGSSADEGTDVVIADRGDKPGTNATLALLGRVTGRLVNPDGTPFTGRTTLRFFREVRTREPETNAVRTSWAPRGGSVVTSDGYYELAVPAGTYRVEAAPDGLGRGFLPGLVGLDKAADVSVAAEKVTAVPARTIATSVLSGSVRNPQGAGVAATVEAYYNLVTDIRDGVAVTTEVDSPVAQDTTAADGGWSMRVAHRAYRVRATGTSGSQPFSVYWPSSGTRAGATDVVVNGAMPNVDFTVGRVQVQNTARPWISGGAKGGTTMTANTGTWSPGTTLAVQWLADGSPISGATGDTYTPSRYSSGVRYAIRVTGTQAGLEPLTVSSQETGPSAGLFAGAPFENRLAPSITGTPATGSTLTASNGEWSTTPTAFTYQWTADGTNIAGATARTFDPSEAQVGRRIAVKVTATGGSTATATSAATAPVTRAAITNRVLPTVTGTPREGEKLTATGGTWSVDGPTLAYQWLADGAPIAGVTTNELLLGAAQVGKQVSVRVTATRTGLSAASAESARTPAVVADLEELVNTARPTITGTPVVGGRLTATSGTWTPAPASVTYQWRAGDAPIAGATGASYSPTSAVLGRQLTVVVTARRAGHEDATATSLPTAAVADSPVTVVGGPSVTGRARVGAQLVADAGSSVPGDATATYQWLRDGRDVAGATGGTYRVTADDLGRRIGVRVTYTHPTRATTQRTASLAALVKATPRLRLTKDANGRRAVLRLVVTAPGADPTGHVRVLERGRVVATGLLQDGRVRLVVTKLTDGMHAFTVRYAGDRLTASGQKRVRVSIPG